MSPEDPKARIERLVQADPSISAAAIGRAVKLSRERVRQILNEMGYELKCTWARDGKRGGKR